MTPLNPARVHTIYIECFSGQWDPTDMVVRGVFGQTCFNPVLLEVHREEVSQMLALLPTTFHEGTGASFLEAGWIRDSPRMWTGIQKIVDELLCLGLGLGLVVHPFSESRWHELPGKLPYFRVRLPKTQGFPAPGADVTLGGSPPEEGV
jgi:hypothetical protein